MFVDASALVAILTDEPDRENLESRLELAESLETSALAIWETVVRLTRKVELSVPEAKAEVDQFLKDANIKLIPIGPTESELALEAYDRFGKGRHPARLNLGDCFAYACAKAHGVELLYIGDDFSQTDVNG